jgi:hypothetical protein
MVDFLQGLPTGALLEEDAHCLLRSLERVEQLKGDCLEVGSNLGLSSSIIASKIKGTSRLFCVDIWSRDTWDEIALKLGDRADKYPLREKDAFIQFWANMTRLGLSQVVVPIRMRSDQAIKVFKPTLKFAFIDGCHEYEFVKQDIEWLKYLAIGGEVVFHDYTTDFPGVIQAVDEFRSNRSFKEVERGGLCVTFKKRRNLF